MKKTMIALFLIVFSASFLPADTYIQQKTHSDAFSIMGQESPEKNDIVHLWLGKNKMAQHRTDGSFIIDLDKKQVIMVNHENKSYVIMTLPIDLSQYFPPMMLQMMGNVTVTVTPTGQSEQVNQWKCDVYDMVMDMMMMKMKSRIWATTDVPFDWKAFAQDLYSEMAKVTMRLSDEAVQELQKIQGFQIKQEITVNMMGTDMKTTSEVVEISKKDAPAGAYEVPPGYTQKDKFDMGDLQKR